MPTLKRGDPAYMGHMLRFVGKARARTEKFGPAKPGSIKAFDYTWVYGTTLNTLRKKPHLERRR